MCVFEAFVFSLFRLFGLFIESIYLKKEIKCVTQLYWNVLTQVECVLYCVGEYIYYNTISIVVCRKRHTWKLYWLTPPKYTPRKCHTCSCYWSV